MRVTAAFALVAALISQSAFAYFMTGNDLYTGWQEHQRASRYDADADALVATEFAYYVLGVYDTMELGTKNVCHKDGVNRRQVADVVGKFLDENPAERHLPAAVLIAQALKSAFPCSQ